MASRNRPPRQDQKHHYERFIEPSRLSRFGSSGGRIIGAQETTIEVQPVPVSAAARENPCDTLATLHMDAATGYVGKCGTEAEAAAVYLSYIAGLGLDLDAADQTWLTENGYHVAGQ